MVSALVIKKLVNTLEYTVAATMERQCTL